MVRDPGSLPVGMRRILPVLGIFAGGVVHSSLPHGAFGAYDVPIRASITGGVAAATALVLLLVFRSPPEM